MIDSTYCRRGEGSPLVLLHSLGERWQIWLPVIDRLSKHHDVMAVDLPRFGRSPVPYTTTEDGIRAFGVRSLQRIFDHLGVSRPHVAGNGLGGMLAIAAATTGMVSSATALSPTGFWTPAQRWWVVTHLRLFRWAARACLATAHPPARYRLVRSLIMSRLCQHPRRVERAEALANLAAIRDTPAFDEAIASTRQFSWRSDQQPLVPLTVAWAQRDKMISARHMANAARLLPEAHLQRLARCGHLAMYDDPELVADVILRTCERAA